MELELTLEIHAYAAPPIRHQEDWRQFDLVINGQSFHDYVRVCQIGRRYSTCSNPDEEKSQIDDDDNAIRNDEESNEIKSMDESFDFEPDFDSHFRSGDDFRVTKNNGNKSQKSPYLHDYEYYSDSDSENDNISTISSLLHVNMDKSDDLPNEDSDDYDVQINPNEAPSFEALTRSTSTTCIQEEKDDVDDDENLDDTQSLSYDEVWGNIFDPFDLEVKSLNHGGEKSKQKQQLKNLDLNCTTNNDKNMKNYMRKKNFLLPCILSFTKPRRLRKISKDVDWDYSKYEEMEGQHEPVF